MGCGTSGVNQQPKRTNKDDYDEMMGKNLPNFLVGSTINGKSLVRNVTEKEKDKEIEQATPQIDKKERQVKKQGKKIRGGDANNEDIYENYVKSQKEIKETDKALMRSSFKNHFVFFSLSPEAVDKISQQMFYCTSPAQEYIFKLGDQASCYFIIEKGEVEVIINDKTVRVLRQGDAFGEIALLYNAPRSASIKTLVNSSFWALDRATFRSTIEVLTSNEYEENRKFIDQVTFFSFMTSEQRDAIARTLITTKFSAQQLIVNEGDRADSYYVIKQGQVSILKGDKMLRKMGPKDSFGEQALYLSSVRGASVRAETEVKCIAIGRENLTQILGNKVQIIVFNNLMRWSFEKSQILKLLTKIQLERISLNAIISDYKQGATVFQKGKQCDKLVIVLEGSLIRVDSQDVFGKGQCFGDIYLRSEQIKVPMVQDYKMQSDGVLAVIAFKDIFQIIGGDLETVIKRNENSHEKKIQLLGGRADSSHIKVQDLIFIKKLGQGQFGWVYLVKHNKNQSATYALKSISKASIIEQNLEKHILQEKAVLEIANFPFIMQFVRSFKDDISIYFLVEYIKGMELFDVIRDMGLLKKSDTQFYIGTIILALEYLHQKCVVYRDLKPENIMVNDKGYMYLIDLGTAKPLSKKTLQTYTIIGTPHYMAPEIILGKGYSYNADIWSIGVCMFEFLCGNVPYGQDMEDPYEIYESIMNTEIQYPPFIKDRCTKRLITQLLQKQPEARLAGSYARLKANQWFDDFDWDKLFSKEITPPVLNQIYNIQYIPNPSKLISDAEVQKNYEIGRSVVKEIKAEQQLNNVQSKKQPKNPKWDEDF